MRAIALAAALLPLACAPPSPSPSPIVDPARTGQHAATLETRLVRPVSLRYLLHLPRDYGRDPARRWPLILYLHGGSLRGDDVDTVRVWGLPRRAEREPDLPFIVVSPQAPRGTLWTDTEALVALLDEVAARHAVDPDRIYLTGHSVVPLRESEEMVAALRREGNERVRFTVLAREGYGIVGVYEEAQGRALLDWFLEHRRR